jgi:membrane protein implicated in regulation of membrane protease activity
VIIAYCFSAIIGGALTLVGFWLVFGLAPALAAAPFGASLLAAVTALWIELRRQSSVDERPPIETSRRDDQFGARGNGQR